MRLAISALLMPSRKVLACSSSVVSAINWPSSLPVDAERARLIGRDRPIKLASDLLKAFGIKLAELFDRNLGAADLDRRIGAEAAENIADAPDREADDQAAHDDGHDGPAEPGRGGFVNTAEHGLRSSRMTIAAE